jgi:hypothetical protein
MAVFVAVGQLRAHQAEVVTPTQFTGEAGDVVV